VSGPAANTSVRADKFSQPPHRTCLLKFYPLNWPFWKGFAMSALGQKPTCALQNLMSALLSIATAKADSRKRPCPLHPRKRTRALQL